MYVCIVGQSIFEYETCPVGLCNLAIGLFIIRLIKRKLSLLFTRQTFLLPDSFPFQSVHIKLYNIIIFILVSFS